MHTPTQHKRPIEIPNFPYVLQFADGRNVAIQMPAGTVVRDRGGETAFTPAGVRFLDRVRALFSPLRPIITPGFIRTLRDALRMTQTEFGTAVGVDKMTVFRWEKGTLRPSAASARAIDKLRSRATRRGVLLATEGSNVTKASRHSTNRRAPQRSYRTASHPSAGQR